MEKILEFTQPYNVNFFDQVVTAAFTGSPQEVCTPTQAQQADQPNKKRNQIFFWPQQQQKKNTDPQQTFFLSHNQTNITKHEMIKW